MSPRSERPGPLDDDYAEKVGQGNVFVAMDGDRMIGFIVLVDRSDHLLIENVAVAPERQGEGIGRKLLTTPLAMPGTPP